MRKKTPNIRKDLSFKPKGIAKKKLKRVVKPRVARTRNNGTMTQAMFWQSIRQALRQKSRFWKPTLEVKRIAKRAYKGPNKRQRFEYRCSECENYFPDKEVQVHHIEPAGALNCAADLPGFVERLFCEKEGLKVLCNHCHEKKHKKLVA